MMSKVCVLFVFCIWCIDISHQKPERCLHAPEQGMCMARIPRLRYDSDTNTCVEFIYGGCGGNENNFETVQDCYDICVIENRTTVFGDKCSLKPQTGDCRASIQRFYYDADTNICQVFTYGGCGGNDNNFETQEECLSNCSKDTSRQVDCSLKPEIGLCKASIPRLYYDTESNKCKEFTYGGCGGNSNNFETVEECDKACVSLTREVDIQCHQAKEEGTCKGANPRFYYDPSANTCKEFIYGGCGGNDNNFETFEKCERTCIQPTTDNVCEMKSDKGICRGMILRYYYNHDTQSCGEFFYGGCGGNQNNFDTLDECEYRCGSHAPVALKSTFVILIVAVTHIFGKGILAVLSM